MAFGIFLKALPRNLIRCPGLTLGAFFFIILNFFLESFRCKRYFGFLNKIKIRAKLPDGNMIRCKLPDLVTISEIYLVGVYNALNCSDGSIIFDLGANIGCYSLKISNSCKNSKTIAIEPSQESFNLLKENLGRNNITSVTVVNAAANDKGGELDFYIDRADGASSSIYKRGNTRLEKVKAVRLDDLVKELNLDLENKEIFMKMDVEGAELNVLKGAENILRRNNVSILMETHPKLLNPEKIKEFLWSYNFDVKFLDLNFPFILARK